MADNHTYDAALVLKASATVTASAASATILDVGDGIINADIIFDITAMDISDNDESYALTVQGSPDSDFSVAANIIDLWTCNLSASQVKLTDSDRDDDIGTYVFPLTNFRNDTVLRYLRIYQGLTGTTPSITYSCQLAKQVR